MPYLLNLAALAVSPVQTGSDATAPALPMHMRPQFKISSALTLPSSKLAPSCAATIPVALECNRIATGLQRDATGLQRELYRVSTGVSRDRHKRSHMFPPPATNVGPLVPPSSYERGTTGPTLQLRTWDHWSHPPATNVGPLVPPSSYKRETSVPTPQLRMWDQRSHLPATNVGPRSHPCSQALP